VTLPRRGRAAARGFTLIEVLVALMIVTLGLAALLVAVSGTARTSGFLRDKLIAEWIALNRIAEVQLNTNKFAQNTDTGEVYMANRTWHYDTRYFDTSVTTMKRIAVRAYAGDAKTKGNPIAEATGFLSTALAAPGSSNITWIGDMAATPGGANGGTGTGAATPPGAPTSNTSLPTPGPSPTPRATPTTPTNP
jgi:general secretion pathway protein I